MSGIPIGRREVIVRGDGNCFYRAMALAIDKKTDKDHWQVRASCNNMMACFSDVFKPLLFTSKSIQEHLAKSCKDGTWAETVDMFSCATVLQRNIMVYSTTRQKWMKFYPLVKTAATITYNQACDCPVTLLLRDANRACNHFNLLQAEGDCCAATKPENVPENMTIDLVHSIIDLVHSSKESEKGATSPSLKSKKAKKATPTMKKSKATERKGNPKQRKKILPSSSPDVQEIKSKPKKLDKILPPAQVYTSTVPLPSERKAEKKQPEVVKMQSTQHKHVQQPRDCDKDCKVEIAKKRVERKPHLAQTCKIDFTPPKQHKTDDFEKMRVKELKAYIQQRGVPMSKYNKAELTILAKSLHEMSASVDPDYENDSIDHYLDERLTLPAGKRVPDPFKMSNYSCDFSSLPSFGLIDIFNHLIISKAEYDKDMLASWRSFDEYTLCQNGHVRSLQHQHMFDSDDSLFHVILAHVIPTQREKTQEGGKMYKLWFILRPNGSIYSAFCRCKGGADQGCRHIGAALFELDDFLSGERTAVTSLPAYWNPKPTPKCRPLPFLEVKLSHSTGLGSKRDMTPYDDSWIDSFDPRPTKQRKDISIEDKINFAEKLRNIDKESAILDYLPSNKDVSDKNVQECTSLPTQDKDVSHLTIIFI